jgi:hypothetical protein
MSSSANTHDAAPIAEKRVKEGRMAGWGRCFLLGAGFGLDFSVKFVNEAFLTEPVILAD